MAHEKPARRLVDQRGRRSRTLYRKLNECKCKVLTGQRRCWKWSPCTSMHFCARCSMLSYTRCKSTVSILRIDTAVAVKAVKWKNQYGVPQILSFILCCFKSCLVFSSFPGCRTSLRKQKQWAEENVTIYDGSTKE